MPYTPTVWQNSPSTATPLSAANMNKLETQYGIVADDINTGSTSVDAALDARYPAIKGDTGWVNIAITGGFAAMASPEQPQVRRIGKVLLFRGGWLNTGMTISTTHNIGTIPAGYIPLVGVLSSAGTASGGTIATIRLQSDGIVQIRTGPALSAYYTLPGPVGTID